MGRNLKFRNTTNNFLVLLRIDKCIRLAKRAVFQKRDVALAFTHPLASIPRLPTPFVYHASNDID